MSSNEPMTLPERYSKAIHTSRLMLSEHRRTDADVILAAGLCGHVSRPQTIGPMLFRLMVEYDEVRGQRAIARRNYDSANTHENARAVASDAVTREANRRQRLGESKMTPEELQACMVKAAEDMRDQIAHNAKMAHAFVLMRMQSLASTKQAFGEWAMQMAIRRRFMDVGPMPVVDPEKSGLVAAWRKGKAEQQRVVLALAGRVLDLILDPNCYRCEGRGFNGGYDRSPQKICNDMRKGGCGGSGRRSTKIGKTKEEDDFAGYLLMEVDIMLGRVTREMKERLSEIRKERDSKAWETLDAETWMAWWQRRLHELDIGEVRLTIALDGRVVVRCHRDYSDAVYEDIVKTAPSGIQITVISDDALAAMVAE